MRTSSVTWARLISRSIVKTFSSCTSACCSSTRGCLTMATIFSISSCSFHCHSVNLNCICLIFTEWQWKLQDEMEKMVAIVKQLPLPLRESQLHLPDFRL